MILTRKIASFFRSIYLFIKRKELHLYKDTAKRTLARRDHTNFYICTLNITKRTLGDSQRSQIFLYLYLEHYQTHPRRLAEITQICILI